MASRAQTVGHVESAIESKYAAGLDLSDKAGASAAVKRSTMLARGLAAMGLAHAAGIEPSVACAHVVDGTQDNGIDALYFDQSTSTLFVVQAKWRSAGTGSISVGDFLKVRSGYKKLTDKEFSKFNPRFEAVFLEMDEWYSNPDARVCFVIVSSGDSDLSVDVQAEFDQLLEELNEFETTAEPLVIGLHALREHIVSGAAGPKIDLTLTVDHWGAVQEPYAAFYGTASANDLVDIYEEHGGRLFDENLRKALGNTSVNSEIAHTVASDAPSFWYFNNGVTVLGERVKRLMLGSASRDSGQFAVEGMSVVNGAQTISTLARARGNGEDLSAVRVWIRLISLEGARDGFATEVTQHTNTQNAVEARDFFALDPEQERLRQDMLLSHRLTYTYRRGDHVPVADSGTTASEAVVALACADPDSELAVIAKSAVGRLHDTGGRYYGRLFNASVTADSLWATVVAHRVVEEVLEETRRATTGRASAVAQQGNRLIAHIVLQRMGGRSEAARWLEPDTEPTVAKLAETVYTEVAGYVETHFSGNYITSLFKNTSRCKQIADALAER